MAAVGGVCDRDAREHRHSRHHPYQSATGSQRRDGCRFCRQTVAVGVDNISQGMDLASIRCSAECVAAVRQGVGPLIERRRRLSKKP